jgi:hypothetical protein
MSVVGDKKVAKSSSVKARMWQCSVDNFSF